jgi:hypothetical protein
MLMKDSPKCPKCQTEMEAGWVMDRGHGDFVRLATWVQGEPERSFWMGMKVSGKKQLQVQTFRCPQCGYLESYAR